MVVPEARRRGAVARLEVVVSPGARETAVAGVDPWRHALRVRVAARPRDGDANAELIRFLAERLGVSRSRVRILSGAAARRKTIAVEGFDREAAVRRLAAGAP